MCVWITSTWCVDRNEQPSVRNVARRVVATFVHQDMEGRFKYGTCLGPYVQVAFLSALILKLACGDVPSPLTLP